MKITTQQELDKLIATVDRSNTIVLDENLEITFNCKISCNIKVYGNIEAQDIDAPNIDAPNIIARNIKACDIKACNIKVWDIKADNIIANNIDAYNIKAKNIEYRAFCIAYESLRCESIAGTRENSFHKCLDREIEIVKKEEKVTIELTQSQLDKIKHLI